MIGRQQDDGVVVQARAAQRCGQASDLPVDLLHQAIVVVQVFAEIVALPLRRDRDRLRHQIVFLRAVILHVLRLAGIDGHVRRRRRVAGRAVVRAAARMRPNPVADVVRIHERRHQQEGLPRLAGQKFHASGGHRLVHLRAQAVAAGERVESGHTVKRARQVPLAAVQCPVTVRAKVFAHRRDSGGDRLAIVPHAGLVRHAAGEKTAARRRTERIGAVGFGERNTVPRQRVHGRSAEIGITVRRKRAVRLLVGDDE